MQRQGQILSCVIAAGLLAATFALTQTTPSSQVQQATQPEPTAASLQAQQAPPQNPYFEDTANLNKMALDLQQQVGKSTKDQLSLTVIRRAEEIEKLAHSLKQRMRAEGGVQ